MTDNAPTDTQNTKTTLSSEIQPTNPSASPSTQTSSDLPPSFSTDKPSVIVDTQQAKEKTKPKGKKAKARPRRRVAESDNESDAEGGGSDGSLTDPSSASESESEPDSEDDDEEGEPQPMEPDPNSKSKSDKPAFADPNSTTPAIWSDKDKSTAEEVTFEEFNKSGLASRGDSSSRGKGKGRGGSSTGGVKREYTEEETKKYEELKAKRKEKQKAKKAEFKELKRKEREAGTVSGGQKKEEPKTILTKGKGKKKESEVDGVVASTSELKLEEKAGQNKEEDEDNTTDKSPSPPVQFTSKSQSPQKGRRGSKSQFNIVNDDPKIVPRQGKFWTHDQRSEPQLQQNHNAYGREGFSGRGLPDWRGRGLPRGGFRGRGGRGGFVNGPNNFGRYPQQGGVGKELTSIDPSVDTEKEKGEDDGEEEGDGEPLLEMDRLEKELAKKVKTQPSNTNEIQPKEKKWGHEGFEQIQEKERKPLIAPTVVPRGGFRGLPRGRGRGFGPRGGHIGQPFRQPLSSLPFHPANLAANAAAAKSVSATPPVSTTTTAPITSSAPSVPVAVTVAAPTFVQSLPTAEEQSTQPDSDDLLGETSQAVTIKLPGSSVPVEIAVVATPTDQILESAETAPSTSAETTSAPAKTPELNASGQAILYTSPVPPPQPVTQQSQPPATIPSYINNHPVPSPIYPNVSAPSPFAPGSDNGSISSGALSHSHFVPTHPQPRSNLQQNIVPTGYGMGSEFVPSSKSHQMNGNQSRPFYPGGNNVPRSYPTHQQQQQKQRPPIQPFYPHQQSYEYQPQSQRGSFSSSQHQPQSFYPQQVQANGGYIDGRGSPFSNPSPGPVHYPTPGGGNIGNVQMNYFVPARQSQKISIKPPSSSTSTSEKDKFNGINPAAPTFASLNSTVNTSNSAEQQQGYYPQHYNPYNNQLSQNGYTNQNGLDENGYYNIQAHAQNNGYQSWEGQVGYGYEGNYGY